VGALSGAADPAQQTLVAIEVLGFPTSAPAPDPRDRNFVYQRFQRSVLQYNALTGLTQPLLMADYLKSIITGRDLPLVLATQAQRSRLYLQYQPSMPSWVSRPADLPATDLTMTFEPDEPPLGGGVPAPLPPPGSLPPPLSGSAVPPQPFSSPGSPGLQPTSNLLPVPPTLVPSSQAGASPAVQGTPPTPATVLPTRNPATPVIERTEPGGAAVGQDIVLRGRNFGDQAGQVLFTGKLATSQVWADDFIVVTVPQGAADGTVRIRRPDGVLSNAVGFSPEMTATPGTTPSATVSPTPSFTPSPSPTPVRPVVAAVEPYFGGVGSSVLIRGTGFGTTTGNVLLGSQSAPVQLWSDTSVLVNIPTGADTQTQRIMRLRVVRADGAVGEPPACFIVSPGTPTPGPAPAGTPPAPTAVPPQPSAC
jgi:hypothetical protein